MLIIKILHLSKHNENMIQWNKISLQTYDDEIKSRNI